MLDYLTVGTIINVHGVRGEVKIMPETDDNARFKKLKEAYLCRGEEREPVKILGVKLQNQFVILKLEGVDDRDKANLLRGAEIQVARKDAVQLPEDSYYIGDLLGCTVKEEDGTCLGTVREVIPGAGCDIYSVTDEEGRNIMIPALGEVVLNVDVAAGNITVRLLPGLREIYLG